ncbi:MAG: hypothetical protein ACIAQZ_10865 [Sedimentisphaeraceae bacterium JB056]
MKDLFLQKRVGTVFMTVALICVSFSFAQVSQLQMVPEHMAIDSYEGPRTCTRCHEQEAMDMFSSVHYQWTGQTPNVTNLTGTAGKADRGFNTYCGTVITSRRFACWGCHVGNGKAPDPQASIEQINNIDCLMCHSAMYSRTVVAPFDSADFNLDRYVNTTDLVHLAQQWLSTGCDVVTGCEYTDIAQSGDIDMGDYAMFSDQWNMCTDPDAPCNYQWRESVMFTDYQGIARTWMLPSENANGDYQYGPNANAMAIDIVQAAQTVHTPTRATCLRCHAYAAGTDCGKRGDLGSASVSPPLWADVHMSEQGQNFNCQQCHTSTNHHVLGRGLDLRPNDVNERLTCTSGGCHSETPHSNTRLDQHTGRIACQSCHIPSFAKLDSTEMERDWESPVWNPGLFGGQGGYVPEDIREMFVVPTYKWYDGTSRVYAVGEVAQLNPAGQYEFGAPNGWVNTPGAKIHPMKEHFSNSAILGNGVFVPHATSTYFLTGDFALAVEEGKQLSGMTGTWSLVPVHTYQTINHTVEPTYNALSCGDCHESLSTDPARMDLTGDLGYALKGSMASVCTQCHGIEDGMSFSNMHNKHVTDKRRDCSWCHNFSRPDRNLVMP